MWGGIRGPRVLPAEGDRGRAAREISAFAKDLGLLSGLIATCEIR
jgi:hypothetical protein